MRHISREESQRRKATAARRGRPLHLPSKPHHQGRASCQTSSRFSTVLTGSFSLPLRPSLRLPRPLLRGRGGRAEGTQSMQMLMFHNEKAVPTSAPNEHSCSLTAASSDEQQSVRANTKTKVQFARCAAGAQDAPGMGGLLKLHREPQKPWDFPLQSETH